MPLLQGVVLKSVEGTSPGSLCFFTLCYQELPPSACCHHMNFRDTMPYNVLLPCPEEATNVMPIIVWDCIILSQGDLI
jgi:hypothetical protein